MYAAAEPTLAPGAQYYSFPYSLDPLSGELKTGLIPISFFAVASLILTTGGCVCITTRMIWSQFHGTGHIGRNQYIVLILNLLLADMQQSFGFVLSLRWLQLQKIVAPSSTCSVQGWFVQLGDIGNGLFVLAIGVHTYFAVVRGYQLPHKWFIVAVTLVWVLTLLLAILGPASHERNYFARAGAWCWVAEAFEHERLWYYYVWIFLSEFGTVLVYCFICLNLHQRMSTILHSQQSRTPSKIKKASLIMVAYPFTYVLLTLPLAIGRMYTMANGKNLSDTFYCVTGCLMTSCGWVDGLLYNLTRRALMSSELSKSTTERSRGSNNKLSSFNHSADLEHSVVITAGTKDGSTAPQSKLAKHRTSAQKSENWHGKQTLRNGRARADNLSLSDISNESMDPIIRPVGPNEVKTETRVEVRIEPRAGVRQSEDDISLRPANRPSMENWN